MLWHKFYHFLTAFFDWLSRHHIGIMASVRFQLDTDVRKLVLIWNWLRIRIFDLKRYIPYFEGSGCETNVWSLLIVKGCETNVWSLLTSWRKLHIAQSFIYYLRKHIFSFLFNSESIYALLKTHF